jgi:hypothetical protein
VTSTITGVSAFGSRWRNATLLGDAPIALAATA